jgi:hypothetical protein
MTRRGIQHSFVGLVLVVLCWVLAPN